MKNNILFTKIVNNIFEDDDMIFQRTELLIGKENLEKLQNSHVIVFGVGGVGGFVIEALARAGVGELSIGCQSTFG